MNRLSNQFLYFFVLICLLIILMASFGEMAWGAARPGEFHWTEKLFFNLCHQLPDRTYATGGLMMAVNTRCFGIFLGIAAGWMMIPFVAKHLKGKRWPVVLLMMAITLQIVDYLGNLVELWQNTNHSRAFLGALFGTALSVSVSDLFLNRNNTNT